MNNDPIEDLLRGLRPGPLPADLRERMAKVMPTDTQTAAASIRPRGRSMHLWLTGAGLATAACAAILAVALSSDRSAPGPASGRDHLCVRRQESELVGSRPVAVLEHNGRLWEVAEQDWLDGDSAFCSATPVRVQMVATRREIVCRPVDFD